MVDDDPEGGNGGGQSGHRRQLVRVDQHVQGTVVRGEQPEVPADGLVAEIHRTVRPMGAHAEEQRVGREALELLCELGPARYHVAHDTEQERVACREVEQPLIVLASQGLASTTTVPVTPSGRAMALNSSG